MYVCMYVYGRNFCWHVFNRVVLFIAVYVCAYVCMYVCVYGRNFCSHVFNMIVLFLAVYVCAYVCMNEYMNVCMCRRDFYSEHLQLDDSYLVSSYECMSVHMYVCRYVGMYVCMYVCIYVSYRFLLRTFAVG